MGNNESGEHPRPRQRGFAPSSFSYVQFDLRNHGSHILSLMQKGLGYKPSPFVFCYLQLSLSPGSDLAIAIAAIDWPALSRLKRNFGFLATLGAHCGIHLTPWAVATRAAPGRSPRFAAGRTALRLIGVPFISEEFLFLSSKGKASTALEALQCFSSKAHRMTSFLLMYLAKVRSSRACAYPRGNYLRTGNLTYNHCINYKPKFSHCQAVMRVDRHKRLE